MIEVMVGKRKFYVKGEANQWVIGKMYKETDKETNKKVDRFHAELFYSSLDGLIKSLLEMKLRVSDSNSLTELQYALKRAKDELSGLYDTAAPKE